MHPDSALVVVPGIGLGGESWTPTLRHLGGPPRVIARPLPGYGLPPAGRSLEVRALAGQVLDAVPDDVERYVVAGHSAGCQVAAHVAALDPRRVSGLVLVGPTTDPRARSWSRLAARWLATAVHEDPRQLPSLVRQYARTTLAGMARAMEAARHDDLCEALARTRAPVLVVRGSHDRICPPDWAEAVARAGTAGGGLVSLPAGAHMVPVTHGHLLAAAVEAFPTAARPFRSA